ncbi:S8/S53 family peptidase [Spartinivicinus ruber]|uniref:S8/S53 family peptidase n=1 Tax=Spartinivicinus ruber TaxID=2683272 RepID=UPI0013D07D50|nr:S8/S53 family peptidase [Spartinivicinus ruber]
MIRSTTLFCLLFILPCLGYGFPFAELEVQIQKQSDINKYLLELDKQFNNQLHNDLKSIKTLMSIIGMESDNNDIVAAIESYYAVDIAQTSELLNLHPLNIQLLHIKQKKYNLSLIKKYKAYKWTNTINEFKSLAQLIYSFLPQEQQEYYQPKFDEAITTLDSLNKNIKSTILIAHPRFNKINIKQLQKQFTGEGATIAVFDVFEESLITTQRKKHKTTTIESIKKFGDPVSMSHGNAVIDIILSIAPKSKIIPISTDTQNYNKTLRYILTRKDITIVNMSRTFLEKEGHLDSNFRDQLIALTRQAIVTKSLGNCGTDLYENLSPIRQQLGLGKVGAITCYDTKLINSFLVDPVSSKHQQHILYAINTAPFADQTALTATVPGNFPLAQLHSLAVPAEGVYTAITDNFESGSSFAAPQLAAISALLYQASTKYYPNHIKQFHLWQTTHAIKQTANSQIKPSEEFGLGLVDGDNALQKVKSGLKL